MTIWKCMFDAALILGLLRLLFDRRFGEWIEKHSKHKPLKNRDAGDDQADESW